MLPLLFVFCAPPAAVQAPPGFAVKQFAGAELANDIFCIHVDGRGRVHAAGRGYVRELTDATGDGVADGAVELLANLKDGPMGLLREGDALHFVADSGLKRATVPGDAAKATTVLALKTAGEHDAHAVRRGPDGKLYWLCGNMAGVTATTVTDPASPVKDPVAGCLLRLDGDGVSVLADGFRNAYDFDFGPGGEPFTYDSDNERCIGLPWFEPTRFYRVLPGGSYGWRSPQLSQTWRKPPDFPDVVPPVCTVGRGSPTGVAYGRRAAFPAKYRTGFFLADWTFGKVWFVPLTVEGTRYVGTPELFLSAVGSAGFAPTGLAVDPKSGDLFVSTGGRGTRGAVYRVTWTGSVEPVPPEPVPPVQPVWPRNLNGDDPTDTGGPGGLRKLQLRLGDLTAPSAVGTAFEGYTARGPVSPETMAKVLPLIHKLPLTAERLRTQAVVADPTPQAVTDALSTITPSSPSPADIHALLCLARFPAPRTPEQTTATAAALLGLEAKVDREKQLRDRHWPLRVAECAAALAKHDPALPAALTASPRFGAAGHAVFLNVPNLDLGAAGEKFLKAAAKDPEYAWTPAHLRAIAAGPDPRAAVERLADADGMADAVLPYLAADPKPADRTRFTAGLRSTRPATLAAAAKGIAKLGAATDAELAGMLRGLKSLPPKDPFRGEIVAALRTAANTSLGDDYPAWETWAAARPALAALLTPPTVAAAKARLAKLDLTAGDAARGKAVFAKATCTACHNTAAAVGPSLDGVAGRFGKQDLVTAVIDPDRDVPARYRVTKFNLIDGGEVRGVIIYEATDGVLLQTNAADAVRVPGEKIASKQDLAASLMPAGLLDPLTDAEIADLFAYLATLGAKK